MRKFLTWVGVWLVAITLGIIVFWDVPNWRLYDMNWQPLAMTHAENYCAGKQFALDGYANNQDNPAVDQCVAQSDKDNLTPSIANSVTWACEGWSENDPSLTVADCVAIVSQYDVWFLQHGGFTFWWNDAHPRPVVAYDNLKQAPRGERDDEERIGSDGFR